MTVDDQKSELITKKPADLQPDQKSIDELNLFGAKEPLWIETFEKYLRMSLRCLYFGITPVLVGGWTGFIMFAICKVGSQQWRLPTSTLNLLIGSSFVHVIGLFLAQSARLDDRSHKRHRDEE